MFLMHSFEVFEVLQFLLVEVKMNFSDDLVKMTYTLNFATLNVNGLARKVKQWVFKQVVKNMTFSQWLRHGVQDNQI